MTGANYMGGKRNAVRARTKDVTSRLQKGHFGKQRLNLLAHGVVRNNAHYLKEKPKSASIDLAHARGDYSKPREPPTRTYILPPARTSKDVESHNSAPFAQPSRSKPSKLLTALEKLEPISFYSRKNRLLKISDFAGLFSKPAEAASVADQKTRMVQSPVGKRKVDDSDQYSRHIEKKRKLLQVSNPTLGSSPSGFPPSPSLVFPPRLSVRRSNSSILSFQESAGSSEFSSGDQSSIAGRRYSTYKDSFDSSQQGAWPEDEPIISQCDYNLAKLCRTTESFSGQEDTWETPEMSGVPAHPPTSDKVPVELIEMSKDWCEMVTYLRLDDCHLQQATRLQGNISFKTFTATDDKLPNDPSDLSLPTLTPRPPVSPKPWGGGSPCPHGVWEEQKFSNTPMDFPVPSSASSLLPFSSMEVLEYDTQPESQQLPIYTGRAPQLLSDDVLVLSSVSPYTPPPSANTNTENNRPCVIPGEPSHNIATSQDRRKFHRIDPLIQDFNQSINCCSPPSDSLSWDSMTVSYLAPHGSMPKLFYLVGDINVDSDVRPLEYPEDLGEVATGPKSGAGFYSGNVETNVTGLYSISVNTDRETSIATTKSEHPEGGATIGNVVQTLLFEDHTESEARFRGPQTTHLDHVRPDSTGPKGFIEGPLLFTLDKEEIEYED